VLLTILFLDIGSQILDFELRGDTAPDARFRARMQHLFSSGFAAGLPALHPTGQSWQIGAVWVNFLFTNQEFI